MGYKQMIEGNQHFKETPRPLGYALRVLFYSFVIGISLYIFLYQILHISFFYVFLALIILYITYYSVSLLHPKEFPTQVSEEMVALPETRGGNPRKTVSIERVKKRRLAKIVPFSVDLKDYIHSKANRNVLITGSSGQGKSKLTRHLLSVIDYQKIIFSFKPSEEYLKMGYTIRDISKTLPDPFLNPEAFVNAFVVAFPLGSVGIQASLVPTALEKLVKKSSSWADLNKELAKNMKEVREMNVRSALSFVRAHSERLAYSVGSFSIGSDTVVLDFSALNDDAKSFYAELVLRQIYSDMEKQQRKNVLICVDEAHRLTTGQFGRYHTLIIEMAREIRDKGMLWVTTQNYTDIPDGLRNQFATQFLFKTTSQNDLAALRAIDPLLAWTASTLSNHYFVDAQFPNIHQFIPAYYYNPKGEKDEVAQVALDKESQIASNRVQTSKLEHQKPPEDRPTPTLHAAMLAIYENAGAGLGKLAKYLKSKGWITSDPTIYGSKDRRGVLDSLVSLGYAIKEGTVYKLDEKALWWIDPSMLVERAKNTGSDLHKQLMRKVIEFLHKNNTLVVVPEGIDVPDLIAYPMSKGNKKYLWDDKNRRAYEIQTSARKDNVLTNKERDIKLGLPITWVCYDKEILEDLKNLTNFEDEYLLIKL